MLKQTLLIGIVILYAIVAAGCKRGPADDHAGHDHRAAAVSEPESHTGDAHEEHAEHEEPAGHEETPALQDEHEAHDGHEGEEGEGGEIEVSAEAMLLAGITTARAAMGTISSSIDVAGEVGFNEDRLARITPRFSGVARELRPRVGEYVKAGDIVAVIESNESMSHYSIRAPIAGRIIEKNVTSGEYVPEDRSMYLLADLSNVWVNLAVYPKDAQDVKPGQKVTVSAVGSAGSATGTIQYVTPVMDPSTRRITARVVLPNTGGEWRPGTFVTARIETGGSAQGLVVHNDAVQTLDDESVVFVQHEPGRFKPVVVTTGRSDSRWTQLISGLSPGDEYVSAGAFELKAKIVTSSLDAHAGHGH